MNLELKNIYKAYGDLEIFSGFSVSFSAGSINCILGPSGCGKTTLLNILNGTVTPEKGTLDDFRNLRYSCVFQEPRLLPWKTVRENVAFVLKERYSENQLEQKLTEYLSIVELDKFMDFYPSRLSGGMKQRVALARAFSFDSDIILLDEPFKALDYRLKYNLIDQFLKLWEGDQRTVIFVTHDVDEALHIGHHLFLFSHAPVNIISQLEIPPETEKKEILRKALLNNLNGNSDQ